MKYVCHHSLYPKPYYCGPPILEGLPAGIVYDGDKFLVTTLAGLPFQPASPALNRLIYQLKLDKRKVAFGYRQRITTQSLVKAEAK